MARCLHVCDAAPSGGRVPNAGLSTVCTHWPAWTLSLWNKLYSCTCHMPSAIDDHCLYKIHWHAKLPSTDDYFPYKTHPEMPSCPPQMTTDHIKPTLKCQVALHRWLLTIQDPPWNACKLPSTDDYFPYKTHPEMPASCPPQMTTDHTKPTLKCLQVALHRWLLSVPNNLKQYIKPQL